MLKEKLGRTGLDLEIYVGIICCVTFLPVSPPTRKVILSGYPTMADAFRSSQVAIWCNLSHVGLKAWPHSIILFTQCDFSWWVKLKKVQDGRSHSGIRSFIRVSNSSLASVHWCIILHRNNVFLLHIVKWISIFSSITLEWDSNSCNVRIFSLCFGSW